MFKVNNKVNFINSSSAFIVNIEQINGHRIGILKPLLNVPA